MSEEGAVEITSRRWPHASLSATGMRLGGGRPPIGARACHQEGLRWRRHPTHHSTAALAGWSATMIGSTSRCGAKQKRRRKEE
jgi:hypothetical protein